MPLNTESQCRQAKVLLDNGLGSQVLVSSDPLYGVRQAMYWSKTARLKPACIVRPRSPSEVSTTVKALVDANEKFAIRSGGHATSAGVSNIEDGVTIDLSLLSHIEFDEKSETVRIGPGNTWKQVYKELQKQNRVVAGSRDGNVGVGGFLLGGGYSWITACEGWGCDNVVAYEVVLADGQIVTADRNAQADLFVALKGGGNNYGIVTSFMMRTMRCDRVWGGKVVVPKEAIPDVIRITSSFANNVKQYPHSNLIVVITYLPEKQDMVASGAVVQTRGVEADAALKDWMDLPNIVNTTKMTTTYELTFEMMLPKDHQ